MLYLVYLKRLDTAIIQIYELPPILIQKHLNPHLIFILTVIQHVADIVRFPLFYHPATHNLIHRLKKEVVKIGDL
jgi:hypothetical protein